MLIMTTRFNEKTWNKNTDYRIRTGKACVYCSPSPLAVPLNTTMFVIEMNNSTNKIEGIGAIRNVCRMDIHYGVYDGDDQGFNRYVFQSDYHLNRDEIIEQSHGALVEILDEILFIGKAHYKRGRSITALGHKFYHKWQTLHPVLMTIGIDIIERNLVEMIREMFRRKYVNIK